VYVNHDLLLAKIQAYGFSETATKLLGEYLKDRRQRVKIDGICSDWSTVKTGVPQRSLLGPLLFNIYINDINYCTSNMVLRLYADDTTSYTSDVSSIALQFMVNQDLSILTTWFNHLSINNTKTRAMILGSSTSEYDFQVNSINVKVEPTLKILGVTLDKRLIYKEHITEQLKKVYAKTAALKRISRFISVNTMTLLYKTFIVPHLEYCSTLFIGLGKVQANRLEDANYYILRTLFRVKNNSYESLLELVKSNTLRHRRYYQALILIYKCLNSIGPSYITDFLNLRHVGYNLRGQGSNLAQPHFNSEWMHKSFSFIANKIWNKLPMEVRKSENIKDFKTALKKFNLELFY